MKTVCIYHSIDLDGWMSAAIVKHWFKENNKGFIKDTDDSFCDFIGYNYGQPIPDLSEYDKVIMCDISFPKEDMLKICLAKELNFIWLDHHQIQDIWNYMSNNRPNGEYLPEGIRNDKFAACELTWKYFFPNEPMPEIVRLLGRYDCFGHKGTDEEQKVLEFQYGARSCINNYNQCYDWLLESINYQNTESWNSSHQYSPEAEIYELGKAIYKYLCTEAKQAYKNGFEIKLVEEITDHIGKNIVNRKFICINKERFNPINFGIDYHKDGYDGAACFHFDGTHWRFSLYNDNGLVDCSQIAKQFGGGGHKGAAGFTISNTDNIDSFFRPRSIWNK